jgi:Sulfotransferase family
MPDLRPLRYPDFICIGAQKGGTTWFDRMLRQHPDIWLPPTKEVHYFNRLLERKTGPSKDEATKIDEARMQSILLSIRRALNSGRSREERLAEIYCLSLIGTLEPTDETYGRIFQTAPENALCGEITPNYARLPDESVEHMIRLQPNLKVIFILRDPIERDWSHLRMQDQRGELQKFTHVERLLKPALLGYSDYMTTIERYRRHVQAQNFLILFFDDIANEPRRLLAELFAFLGLDYARTVFKNVDEPVHAGQPRPMPPELYEALRKNLAPAYRRLLSLGSPIVQKWYDKHYGSLESRSAAVSDVTRVSG